ncbi:hypothetical protein CPC08DRAFT_769135 [Agrocybe pediades]|nr:hypothetical protein CPC08DRAFT_769135 [Agrocybe pediades]
MGRGSKYKSDAESVKKKEGNAAEVDRTKNAENDADNEVGSASAETDQSAIRATKRSADEASLCLEERKTKRIHEHRDEDCLDGKASISSVSTLSDDSEIAQHNQARLQEATPTESLAGTNGEATMDRPTSNKPASTREDAPVSPHSEAAGGDEIESRELAGTYDNLPKLRIEAQLEPVNDEGNLPGFFNFDLWEGLIWDKDGYKAIERIKEAVLFSDKHPYFNPARADPRIVTTKLLNPKGKYPSHFIVSPKNPKSCMIALITGSVMSCNLREPWVYGGKGAQNSSISKRISIVPHGKEFERYVNFIGTVFGLHTIKAPCFSNYTLTFSTKPESGDGSGSPSKQGAKLQNFLSQNLKSPAPPKASRSRSGGRKDENVFVKSVLSSTQDVPIYDASSCTFAFDEIENVTGLPTYRPSSMDIPEGSCVTVAHTIGVWKNNDGEDMLTLNVHSVVLWAKPDSNSSFF